MKTYDFKNGKRGAVLPVAAGKERITICLDTDILNYFRDQVETAGGGSYQALMNQALREHMEEAVSTCLGHANTNVTAQIYVHALQKDDALLADLIDKAMEGSIYAADGILTDMDPPNSEVTVNKWGYW